MDFEWNIFTRFNTLQFSEEVNVHWHFPWNKRHWRRMFRLVWIHNIAVLRQSQKFSEQISGNTRKFHSGQWTRMSGKRSIRKDNGCSMFLVFKRSNFVSVRTVDKESEKKWRARTWKIGDSFCGRSGNSWDYFAQLLLQISSVVAEQSRKHVKNMKPFTTGRFNVVMWWWDNQLCSVLKTEAFLESDDPAYRNFLVQWDEERIEKPSQQHRLSEYFLWMQDFWVLLRMDGISWLKTLKIWQNFMQWLVVKTLS